MWFFYEIISVLRSFLHHFSKCCTSTNCKKYQRLHLNITIFAYLKFLLLYMGKPSANVWCPQIYRKSYLCARTRAKIPSEFSLRALEKTIEDFRNFLISSVFYNDEFKDQFQNFTSYSSIFSHNIISKNLARIALEISPC